MILAWLVAGACFAAPVPSDAPPDGPRVVLRAIAEHRGEAAIAAVYRSGGAAVGLGLGLPVTPRLDLDLEAAYSRVQSRETDDLRLELLPLSALGAWHARPGRGATPYAGLGATWTAFSEHHPADPTGRAVTSGARLGVEARLGLRIDTGFVQPPLPPADTGPVRRLEIDTYLARRSRLPLPDATGFDLGGWRLAVGVSWVLR